MTTNTDIDAGEHPPQGEDGAEQKKTKPFARKGVRIGVAAAATVALVASGVTAWAVHDHRARVADAHQTYEAAIAEAEDRGAQSRTEIGGAYVDARKSLDELVEQGRQVLQDSEDRVDEDQEADGQLRQKEDRALLRKALGALPASQRKAFVLSYYQDLSNQEVAEVLQLKLKAVESLLYRARQNMKSALIRMSDEKG